MKRLLLLMAALLACGLIAAGCGGDDDDSADDSPATTETAPPVDTTATETTESEDDSGGTTPPADDETIDAAVEACKEGVRSSGQELSDDLVSDLEDLCEQAADGDEAELREASLEICRRIVEETVPEGPARDQALETCDQSVPTP
jgi:hypothetical protein